MKFLKTSFIRYFVIIFISVCCITAFLVFTGKVERESIEKIQNEYPVLNESTPLKEIVLRLHYYRPEIRTSKDDVILVTSKRNVRIYTEPLFAADQIRDVISEGDSLIRKPYNDTLTVTKRYDKKKYKYLIKHFE